MSHSPQTTPFTNPQIAAETMNNYLMFTSHLKASVIPIKDQHPKMFAGHYKKGRIRELMEKREEMEEEYNAVCLFFFELWMCVVGIVWI